MLVSLFVIVAFYIRQMEMTFFVGFLLTVLLVRSQMVYFVFDDSVVRLSLAAVTVLTGSPEALY